MAELVKLMPDGSIPPDIKNKLGEEAQSWCDSTSNPARIRYALESNGFKIDTGSSGMSTKE